MNFGLNKVTGTDRQTVEQLKHKVIDGGGGGGGGDTWEEVSKDDMVTYLEEDHPAIIWYELPNERFHVEAENGGELSILAIDKYAPSVDSETIQSIAGINGIVLFAAVVDVRVYESYKIISVIGYADDYAEGVPDLKQKFEWCLPKSERVFVLWCGQDEEDPDNPWRDNPDIKFYKKV